MVLIRPIADADHSEVLSINAGSRPAVALLDRIELRRLLACGGLHLAAVADDRTIVGYTLAFLNADPYDGEEFGYFLAHIQKPFIYIDQVAVRHRRQRAGVARKLYEALIEHAKAREIDVLCCEVNISPPNPVSMAFHQQLGFESVGTGEIAKGRDVSLLIKAL
jgi:hypothetical protein